jgi:hypothetical protein
MDRDMKLLLIWTVNCSVVAVAWSLMDEIAASSVGIRAAIVALLVSALLVTITATVRVVGNHGIGGE